MWERVKLRERERMLGMLFIGICLGLLGYTLLLLSCQVAAEVVGGAGALLLCLWSIRGLWRFFFQKPIRAAVGPLSTDERVKARSKLLKPKP